MLAEVPTVVAPQDDDGVVALAEIIDSERASLGAPGMAAAIEASPRT